MKSFTSNERNYIITIWHDGSRPPLHLPFPIASPAPAFRCIIPLDKQKQSPYTSTTRKECLIKKTFHEVKGKIKEVAGKLSDNPKLQAEGIVEKISGKVQEKIG